MKNVHCKMSACLSVCRMLALCQKLTGLPVILVFPIQMHKIWYSDKVTVTGE